MAVGEIFLAKFGSLGTTLAAEAVCQPTAAHMDPETGQSEKCTEYWFPSATAAEVEVDTETGRVKILQLFSVGDTGTAINPRHCEQQLVGAAVMHLGLTMFEEMIFRRGSTRQWLAARLSGRFVQGYAGVGSTDCRSSAA